jgi:hypothetical protein
MMTGVDRLVFEGSYRPISSTPRSEMVGSSRINYSSLEDGSDIVSCNPVVSKDPCWSSFLLSSGGGGFEVNRRQPKILHYRQKSSSSTM